MNHFFDIHPVFPAFNQQHSAKRSGFSDPLDTSLIRPTDFGQGEPYLMTILEPVLHRGIGDSRLDVPVSAWY